MILSCLYMCLCSRFIHTADDGHMRLRCCGKYVTGIGNVPKIENPRKIRCQDYFKKNFFLFVADAPDKQAKLFILDEALV